MPIPLRRQPALRRFLRDRSGATAVEFAFVAAPLLFMLFAIFELALVFVLSSTLDAATTKVARTIRTGALQTAGGGTKEGFRDAICDDLGWLDGECRANLSVDVRVYGSFENQVRPDPIVVDKGPDGKPRRRFDEGKLVYEEGEPNDIVLVRSFYRWKLISPFLMDSLERLDGGVTLVTAAATFRNEPYK